MAAEKTTRNRFFPQGMTAGLLLLAAPGWLFAQQHHPVPADSHHAASLPPASNATQAPAPIVRPSGNTGAQVSANPNPPPANAGAFGPRGNASAAYGKGVHLGAWMSAHDNLTLPQQQSALDKEPGFRDLPPATQQRIHDRLAQLSAMPPDQRQKMIRHNEFMEKLPPAQRAEVSSTMLQLRALPPDQRKVVTRAFRELRGLPPEQRIPMLNERYRNLTEQQRVTLTQLMRIEPILPPDEHP